MFISPGMDFGEYVVVQRVAMGATSEVFKAQRRDNGKLAALKVLHADWCLDPEVVARFFNEALALQRLDHPHIVKVLDCGALPSGRPFMILEWFPSDLYRVLACAKGALAVHVGMRIALQLARALSVVHEYGIIHRDLKPANVLVSCEEIAVADVLLADLGLAKLLPVLQGNGIGPPPLDALHVSTGQRAAFGTWEYMPPEQWTDAKTVDFKADVYSLGVLLFQMLAGRLPFVAKQQKDWMYYHVIEAPPLGLLQGRASAPLCELVGGMLNKKGRLRPTMHEVAERLGGMA